MWAVKTGSFRVDDSGFTVQLSFQNRSDEDSELWMVLLSCLSEIMIFELQVASPGQPLYVAILSLYIKVSSEVQPDIRTTRTPRVLIKIRRAAC